MDDVTLARKNTILKILGGSRLYGTHTPESDYDEYSIFVPPPGRLFSLTEPVINTCRYQEQPQGERTRPGDTEGMLYSLSHFIKTTVNGDPSTISMLFAPEENILAKHKWGQYLIDNRERFLSQVIGKRYLGYMNSTLRRYLQGRANRTELIDEYGYDTKATYHAVRVAMQGIQLMELGQIILPVGSEHKSLLLDLRNGVYSKEEARDLVAMWHGDLGAAVENTQLPPEPDYSLLSNMNARIHRLYWTELDKRQES